MIWWILAALWVLGNISFTLAHADIVAEHLRKMPPSPTLRFVAFLMILAMNQVLWLPFVLASLMTRLLR